MIIALARGCFVIALESKCTDAFVASQEIDTILLLITFALFEAFVDINARTYKIIAFAIYSVINRGTLECADN